MPYIFFSVSLILSLVALEPLLMPSPAEETSLPTPSTVLHADTAKVAAKINNNANVFMVVFLLRF